MDTRAFDAQLIFHCGSSFVSHAHHSPFLSAGALTVLRPTYHGDTTQLWPLRT